MHCSTRQRGAEEGSRHRAKCREANGSAMQYASEELMKDPEIVSAVKQMALHCGAPEELKKDPEFVLSAVKQYGGALRTRQRS